MSLTTGMGTDRDRRTSVQIAQARELTPEELSWLYDDNPLAARVVEAFPVEATRVGYQLTAPCAAGAQRRRPVELANEAITPAFQRAFQDALVFGALYGGGLLWAILEDDRSPLAGPPPLGRPVRRWHFIERSQVTEVVRDLWGAPESYRCQPYPGAPIVTLHRDRVVRFPGVRTSPRKSREIRGWELSALQRPWETLRDAGSSFGALFAMLQTSSVAVYAVQDLRKVAAQGMAATVMDRIRNVEASRGAHRPVVIDAADSYANTGAPLQGVKDAFEPLMYLLSLVAGVPVAILFGRSAAGLSATGDADFRSFYDRVASYQMQTVAPLLLECAKLEARGRGEVLPCGTGVAFEDPWRLTPAEQATVYSQRATADNIYQTMGALHPDEIRRSRFAPDEVGATGIHVEDHEGSAEDVADALGLDG